MFERMAKGWELARASLRVLRMDKELLVFPLVSSLSCLVVLASFVLPLWNSPYASVVLNDHQAPQDPVAYLILFAFYFVNYFVIVFFNAALVACAIIRFKGGDPTLADGFRAATNRLPQILAWTLVNATVGTLLRTIESHAEKVGQIVAAVVGGAWSIATYFVVPVLVVERVDPITAVKRSLSVLTSTWGESLTANFGIGIVTFLAVLVCGVVPIVGGIVALATQTALGVALIALGIAGIFVVTLVSSTLDSILLAALYLYAAEGQVPQGFDKSLFDTAFQRK